MSGIWQLVVSLQFKTSSPTGLIEFVAIEPFLSAATAAAAAAGAREAKRAGDGRQDDPAASGSFRDHAAFRDAMDDLGLLVGLGQQEVLTLVRGLGWLPSR